MQKKKTLLAFLLPYAIGLLIVRLGIDTIIKSSGWGWNGEFYGGLFSFFIELSIIFLAIRNYKIFQNSGKLLFSEGVKIGVGLLLIVGIAFSIYISFVHGMYIDPDYQQNIAQEAAKVMQQNDPNANTTALTQKPSSPFVGFGMSILKYIFIGAFGGIISAAILKTE